uniref:hypothetical protein n=1 Tax=Elmerina hispida TaxID=1245649 RepID=UPI0030025614|nr:hypothetical protein [Elmerina hispida]
MKFEVTVELIGLVKEINRKADQIIKEGLNWGKTASPSDQIGAFNNSSIKLEDIFGIFKQLKPKSTTSQPTSVLLDTSGVLKTEVETSSEKVMADPQAIVSNSLITYIKDNYGEITVREIIENFEEKGESLAKLKNKIEGAVGITLDTSSALNFVTPLLLYRGILKVYDNATHKEFKANIEKAHKSQPHGGRDLGQKVESLVQKEKFLFRAPAAPLLVLGLTVISKSVSSNVFTIDVNTGTNTGTSHIGNDDSTSMFTPALILLNSIKKDNSQTNNTKNIQNKPEIPNKPTKFKKFLKLVSKISTFFVIGLLIIKNKEAI